MINYGPPEHVYVEIEWYDGPRFGIADINGAPHRFKSLFDEKEDEYLGTFVIWPIDKRSLELEIEQWCTFVEWHERYESGECNETTHPGHGGVNERWDEIEVLLENSRAEIPTIAKKALAEILSLDNENRYKQNGPDYKLGWCIL